MCAVSMRSSSAVTSWVHYDSIYTERYLGLPSESAEAYRRSSPVNSARNLKGNLLIIHNLEDDNVLFQNTLQMADALERAGKPFDLAKLIAVLLRLTGRSAAAPFEIDHAEHEDPEALVHRQRRAEPVGEAPGGQVGPRPHLQPARRRRPTRGIAGSCTHPAAVVSFRRDH